MEWFQYLQSLGIVLLILSSFPVVAHLYRKYQLKSMLGNNIKVLEVKPLNFKAQLLLIEVDGNRFLVGLTDKGFTLLAELKKCSTS